MSPITKNTYTDTNKVVKEIEANKKNWTKVIEIIEDEESKKSEYCECDKILFENLNKNTKNIKNKSIVDFDYNEIHTMDMEELSDYDINTLLKVLIVRGSKNNNPILWSKTKTLLKILNFELKPNQYYNNKKVIHAKYKKQNLKNQKK